MDKQQDTPSNMPVPLLDVTEPQQPRSPDAAEPLVEPDGKSHRQPRLHQICEEHLTGGIGIGPNDYPNDPEEREIHNRGRRDCTRSPTRFRRRITDPGD